MNKEKDILTGIIVFTAIIGAFIYMNTITGHVININGQNAEKITVVLPVMPMSWWSMFYSAKTQGYYAEEGIDVDFVYIAEGGYGVIKQVAAGNGEFGLAGGDSLMVARSNNISVVSIYQQDHSTKWSIISKKDSGINKLSDLEGKTIAIQGPENPLHLAAKGMLKKQGVDYNSIKWIPVGGSGIIPALVGGSADAVTGNEIYKFMLEKKGIEFNIWYPKDYGVDLTSVGILCSEDTLKNNPELVEKFVRASNKGLKYAIANPKKAIDDYLKYFNPTGDRQIESKLWNIVVTDVIQPDKYPLGSFNKKQWEDTQNIMYELGSMKKKIDISKAYTDRFVPN